MTITRVELIAADIDYHEPFRISLMVSSGTQNVFVRLFTEDGRYGIGEASPTRPITGDTQATMLAVGEELARIMLGRSPMDVEGGVAAMRAHIVGNTTIRGAFDMALHDLAAKHAGVPLYALLGGSKRVFETDNTVGIAGPTEMADKAARFVNEGFRAVKVKLGTGFEEDVARIASIRDAIGDAVPVRIDANQGWDVPEAIRILRELDPLGIQYCEQPIAHWNIDGLSQVRASTGIPIMADESVFDHHDAAALVQAEACDYFNIKLAKSAGIRYGLRIAAIAEAAGMACMVGCMSETRLGLSAAAHLVSARPVIRFADLDSHFDHRVDPVLGGIRIEGSQVHLPDGPGHGADLDPEFVKNCAQIAVE